MLGSNPAGPALLQERRSLLVGLVLFAACWLVLLACTSLAPPVDNIEQLTWVRSLQWGYYKHPPLTTWLLWAPAKLLGLYAWTTYVTGAAFTLAAVWLLWALLRELRGSRYATLALGAVLCITYYNDRLYYFNHNVVLMFFASAALALCWRATSQRSLRWWAALGVVLGLGSLAKYQMAVVFASVLTYWMYIQGWRDQTQRTGLLLAGLIALIIFTPHLAWLRTNDFGPIHYALETSIGAHLPGGARSVQAGNWLLDQVLNRALPAWVLLIVALYSRRRAVPTHPERSRVIALERPGRALLVIWGVVPLVFMPLVGLLLGAELQLQWGTSFLLFAVPAVMELPRSAAAWSGWRLKPTFKAFMVVQILMIAVNFITSPRGPAIARDTHWRSFPLNELAVAVGGPARNALAGEPICVVSGPAALASALALELPERPLVLIDGRYDRSPWVNAHPTKPCGMLQLSDSSEYAKRVGGRFPGLTWRAVVSPPAQESLRTPAH